MKKAYLTFCFIALSAFMTLVILSCQKNSTVHPAKNSYRPFALRTLLPSETNSACIPVDTANMMIGSYLASINYSNNDTDVQSFIFNADSLRNYLNDTTHGKIANVKLMMAHTMAYINAGGKGKYAGYQSGALTIIVVGFDKDNNYVYNGRNMVLEHASPCPNACPGSGSAASSTLP